MGRVNKNSEIVEDVSKRSQRRKNSSPYFDFDLDEVWTPNNPHLKHFKNASDKNKKNKTKMQLYGSNQVKFAFKKSIFSKCDQFGFNV